MSSFANATSLTDFVGVANVLTDGLLIFSLEVTVFAVLFLATLAFGKWRALSYSAFVTGALVFVLNLASYNGEPLAPYWHLVPVCVALALGVFMTMQSKKNVGG